MVKASSGLSSGIEFDNISVNLGVEHEARSLYTQDYEPVFLLHYDKQGIDSPHYLGHTALLTREHYINLWSSAYKIKTQTSTTHGWCGEDKLRPSWDAIYWRDYPRATSYSRVSERLGSEYDGQIVKSRSVLRSLSVDLGYDQTINPLGHFPDHPQIIPLFLTKAQIATINAQAQVLAAKVVTGHIYWNLFGSSEHGTPLELEDGKNYDLSCTGAVLWLLRHAGIRLYSEDCSVSVLPEELVQRCEELSLRTYLMDVLKLDQAEYDYVKAQSGPKLIENLSSLYKLQTPESITGDSFIFTRFLCNLKRAYHHPSDERVALVRRDRQTQVFLQRPENVIWSPLRQGEDYHPIRKNTYTKALASLTPSRHLRRVRIAGASGSGKSAMARQLMYDTREIHNYDISFEIDASTEQTFVGDLEFLAKELDKRRYKATYDKTKSNLDNLCEFLDTILAEYSASGKKWILLIDNADDYQSADRTFIKQFNEEFTDRECRGGVLLFTSRDQQAWHTRQQYSIENLGMLKLIEAKNLFKAFYKGTIDDLDDYLTHKIMRYPLDIRLFTSYINTCLTAGHSLETCLAEIRELDLTDFATTHISYDRNPNRNALLKLTIEKIAEMNENFIELMFVMSLFSYNNIPPAIIHEYCLSRDFGEAWIGTLRPTLTQYYLIQKLNPNQDTAHPYVLEFITSHITQLSDIQELLQTSATKLINIIINLIGDLDRLELYRIKELIEYLTPIYTKLKQCNIVPKNNEKFLYNLAFLNFKVGNYNHAQKCWQELLKIKIARYGGQHVEVAQTQQHLADILRHKGKYAEARQLYLVSAPVIIEYCGEKNINTATALQNFADILDDEGQYGEAEKLMRRALKIITTYYKAQKLKIAQGQQSLAIILRHVGKYKEAENLYRKALKIFLEEYGTEHIEVARLQENLAITLRNLERYEEAEKYYKFALKIQIEKFGDSSIEVANTRKNYASLLSIQKKYDKAEKLCRSALKIQLEHYGNRHTEVSTTQYTLASILKEIGQYSNAKQLLESTLEIEVFYYGKHHSQVAMTKEALGLIFLSTSKFKTALVMFQQAYSILQRVPQYRYKIPQLCLLIQLIQKEKETVNLYDYSQHLTLQSQGYIPLSIAGTSPSIETTCRVVYVKNPQKLKIFPYFVYPYIDGLAFSNPIHRKISIIYMHLFIKGNLLFAYAWQHMIRGFYSRGDHDGLRVFVDGIL